MPKYTINETFPNDIFVTQETDNDATWFLANDTLSNAVESCEKNEGMVATYRLVKVENLKLKKTTSVVKVK